MTWPDDYINKIVQGDALSVLRSMPDEVIQCVVTSPPYWGLRTYGHWGMQILFGSLADFGMPSKHRDRWWNRIRWRAAERGGVWSRNKRSWIGALGFEPTPDEYLKNMTAIFREIRRVLRPDGTCWINMGDSYTSGDRATFRSGASSNKNHQVQDDQARPQTPPGLKPKDLVGMPWRLAFALQADGWYLRQDIIWAKPNPMPESVTDRCTKSHEYIFLMTKSAKYFCDMEAVREITGNEGYVCKSNKPTGKYEYGDEDTIKTKGSQHSNHHEMRNNPNGRNKRSVWTIPTQGYKEAHFATFPEKLIVPCIKAGTSEKGCCPACGMPWARVVEKSEVEKRQTNTKYPGGHTMSTTKWDDPIQRNTLGWRPGCECFGYVKQGPLTIPCIVLDPFMGSGTTAFISRKLNRRWIGIELSEEYIKIAHKRLSQEVLAL